MLFFDLPLLGDIIRYAFGSFILGVVLTVAFVFLLFLLIKGFYPRKTFSPISFVAGAVLCVLLVPQMISLCGAVALKIKCGDVAQWLDSNVIHSSLYVSPVDITPEESHAICQRLIDNYPIVASFVGDGEFIGFDSSNICSAIADTLNSFLNRFIWESFGWSFLFLALTAGVVIFTMRAEVHYSHNGRQLQARRNSRPSRISTQRPGRVRLRRI